MAAAGHSPTYARTVGRAVHIKIFPHPRNLAESRQILRVLQQYGNIEMYQHLKHDPHLRAANSALAIYQSQASAEKLIDASPLRLELGPTSFKHIPISSEVRLAPLKSEKAEDTILLQEKRDHGEEPRASDTLWQLNNEASAFSDFGHVNEPETSTRSLSTGSSSGNPTPSDSFMNINSASNIQGPREFHVEIDESKLNHQAYIERQHYYGPFEPNDGTVMYEDLEQRVPVKGMADCDLSAPQVPLRNRQKKLQDNERQRRGIFREPLRDVWKRGQEERERQRRE